MLGWKEAFWLCCLGCLVWVPASALRETVMFSDLEDWQPVGWSLGAWRVCDWGGWNIIKGCLQKEFWRTLFCVCILVLNYWDSGGRTKAEIVSCSAERTFTLFLIPFCFLSCLCNLLPLWEELRSFSLLPKGAADTAPGCQTLIPALYGLVGLGSVGFMVDLMILKLFSNIDNSVILWFSCLSVKISFTGGQRGLCSSWGLLWGKLHSSSFSEWLLQGLCSKALPSSTASGGRGSTSAFLLQAQLSRFLQNPTW